MTSYSGKNRNIGSAGKSKFSNADFIPDSNVVKEFDEYRYFGDTLAYTMFNDQYILNGDTAKINDNPGKNEKDVPAKKSLFSAINTVLTDCELRRNMNMPLWDTPANREDIKSRTACTIKDLVEASEQGKMGRAVYQYADFMFCKDLGKMPNNYMITLRRFPEGCGDHINYTFGSSTPNGTIKAEKSTQLHAPDIGRMITWMNTAGNDMENILTYNYSMPYEDMTAKFEEKSGTEGGGMLKALFQSCDKTYQSQVLKGQVAGTSYGASGLLGNTKSNINSAFDWNVASERAEFLKHYDANRTYGPLDVIMKTKKRVQGLEFSQKFSLNFDYELRSYDGVNGKAAFMDLLANILCVTYTTGKFWGGARINTGAHQSSVYSNLPIWKLENGESDPGKIVDAMIDSLSIITSTFLGGLSDVGNSIAKGWDKDGIKGAINGFLGSGFGSMLLGGMLNKLGRPDKFAYASLLTDAPVGMWHLTIGNPRNPILSIGNLIITDCSIKHLGPLGIDDFPTQIRVSVSLEPAMPRDITRIEQMYMMGDSRIYTPMSVTGRSVYEHSKRYASNVNGETKRGSIDTAEASQSNASNIKASSIDTTNKRKTTDWLTKQFGLPSDSGENVYDLVQRSFDAALNGSGKIANSNIKR